MDDDLWALIEPLLPPWPQRAPGPRPVPDRLCLLALVRAGARFERGHMVERPQEVAA
ncbi:hypothetical protein [Streptomyces sp. NPDC002550]